MADDLVAMMRSATTVLPWSPVAGRGGRSSIDTWASRPAGGGGFVLMIYWDKPYARVQWDDASRLVMLEWLDFCYGDEYKGTLGKVIEALIQNRSKKLLSDTRKMRPIPQEDQEWLMKEWVPRAAKAGLRHIGIVLPKTVLGQMSLQRIVQAGTGDKRFISSDGTSYFESIEDARKWLRSLPD
jgi:hypothetical protein